MISNAPGSVTLPGPLRRLGHIHLALGVKRGGRCPTFGSTSLVDISIHRVSIRLEVAATAGTSRAISLHVRRGTSGPSRVFRESALYAW